MRTWVVGIFIGVCILTSSCKEVGTIPGPQPPANTKEGGLLKPWDFTYDCLTNDKLGKAEIQRCRDYVEQADTDKEVNKP